MNCEICQAGPLTQDDALTISSGTKRHILCGSGNCTRAFFKAHEPNDKKAFPPTADICGGCENHPIVATVRRADTSTGRTVRSVHRGFLL